MNGDVRPKPDHAATSPPDPASAGSRSAPLDRQFWLLIVIASIVLLVRGGLITSAQSEVMDSQFHLRSGLFQLMGNPGEIREPFNDAPLGQVLLALPMWLTGNTPDKPINLANWPAGVSVPGQPPPGAPPLPPRRARLARTIRLAVLYGERWRPQTLLLLVGLWTSLLFVPVIGVIFQWCRTLYGAHAGWLATGLVLIDPSFAACIPMIALDALGVAGVVIGSFCLWRYFVQPSTGRLIVASVAVAAGVLLKHTAVILPGVALLFAGYYWGWRPWREGQSARLWRFHFRARVNAILLGALLFCLGLWGLTGFNISRPAVQFEMSVRGSSRSPLRDFAYAVMDRKWPAGVYVGRFVSGLLTSGAPHRAFLWGHVRTRGWWYYFLVAGTYKVPIGIGVVLALGLASFVWVRWRREEISLLIPLLAWGALMLTTRINMGFRHFLPVYVFMLMLASRCLAGRTRAARVIMLTATGIAWAGVLAAAIHVASWHPDYLSYWNYPRPKWWMLLTDSNVDWGQSDRQIAGWLDAHPAALRHDRAVYVLTRYGRAGYDGPYYLDHRVTFLQRGKPIPSHGLLIISPIWVTGVYDEPGENPYAMLQRLRPIGVVGHAMLVYDLDPPAEATSASSKF